MMTILHYEQHAALLIQEYESLAFEELRALLLDFLPAAGCTILDIGSGRGDAWFAPRGDDVAL